MIPELLWIVPAAPLIGSLLLGLFGSALSSRLAAIIGTASVALSALCSTIIAADWSLRALPLNHLRIGLWQWISLPNYAASVSFYLDPISLVMIVVITLIALRNL